jgi:8-amino-7-oxononanoate synthase
VSDPLAWIDDALEALERAALRRRLAERSSPQRAAQIALDGRLLVNFSSNDYLALAADERLVAAAQAAAAEHGWGSGASPLVTGRSTLHAQLERELAAFEETEAALVFPTGYAANLGTIPALVGKGDTIYSDELNHASLIDGCRLSGARVAIYRHGDVQHLRELLAASPAGGRRLIVTDTLFSMEGDLAPLGELVSLAEEYGAMLLVDEAHATGVFGPRGRGVCEALGVEGGVHIRVGTLSKALGSVGGFVAGSQRLIDWLANRARPYVFSTAAPAAAAAAALEALRIVRQEPQRRAELLARAAALRQQLVQLGLPMTASQSQIVPVVLGEPARVLAAAEHLRQRGLWVPPIRPPSVPPGKALLRISLTWGHTEEHRQALIAALREALR